ncbi:MAG: hypothetical protein R3E12_16495 [Candidatus Eisenbacteria bacterium]
MAAALSVMIFHSVCYYFGLTAADGLVYTVIGYTEPGAHQHIGRSGPSSSPACAARSGSEVAAARPADRGRHPADCLARSSPISAGPAAYFDTVSIFVTLMLLGRWLQEQILERNRRSLLRSSGTEHLKARLLEADGIRQVPVSGANRGAADDRSR